MGKVHTLFRPDFPFAPEKWPFFYGWVIVAMGTLGTLASIPGQTAGVSPFKQPLLQALKLSDIQLSMAYMVGTLASGCIIPYCGQFCDRWGARMTMVITLMAFSLSLLFMSSCQSIYTFALNPWMPPWLVGTIVISLGFFLIRFWGQGMLIIVSRTMTSNWFDRKRGLVAAIGGIFTTIAFNSAPSILNQGVQHLGWQDTFFYLGILYFFGLTCFFWLFCRDTPEASDLQMDGTVLPEIEADPNTFSEFKIYHEFTAEEAIKTWSFWLLTATLGLHGFTITAIFFHASDIAVGVGIGLDQFYSLLVPLAVINVFAGFLLGWLNNKTRLKNILIAYLVLQCLFPLSVLFLDNSLGQLAFIMLGALSGACFGNLYNVACPRFFGRLHLGRINGYVTSALVICSAVGPIFFSYISQTTQSFQTALWMCIGASACLLPCAHKANNPQRLHTKF